MQAIAYDAGQDVWDETRGLRNIRVPRPTLDEDNDALDAEMVLIKVIYSGFCGSDRGIWFRNSFKKVLHESLQAEGKTTRVLGHELLGEVAGAGRVAAEHYGYQPGDIVSTESHIICGRCKQCLIGDTHVCSNEKVIGFSLDGCHAEYVKLPASVLWRTDTARIRPEVACLQEPFGNAVHACTKVDLRGSTVAIFGCGTIGLFAVLIARALGAARIIGIEPSEENAAMAEELGADKVVRFKPAGDSPRADVDVVRQVRDFGPDGVDVAIEMAGYNSSVNNTIQSVRRGGHVVAFGIKSGDFVVQDYSNIATGGISIHGIFGRRIFSTWYMTRNLLESTRTGIQEQIYDVMLNRGEGTIVDIDDFAAQDFEKRILAHPKVIIRW